MRGLPSGLGGTGAQQSRDCSFPAGSVSGAPLRISYFLVIFFAYQLSKVFEDGSMPLWFKVAQVTGNEFLLLATVLAHEMGHGTMARRRGGEMAHILLWPFGGICFTSRPGGRSPHEKLDDELWIVGAGPATHFPMSAAWLGVMLSARGAFGLTALAPAWRFLIPFGSDADLYPYLCDTDLQMQVFPGRCVTSRASLLVYMLIVQAIRLNVLLFLFNVFFPMYPMDGAKLIVCSLQKFCKASARFSAKVLIYTSVPLAVILIIHTLFGMRNGGLTGGITGYMGIMCLQEAYQIHKLLQAEQLHTHPLFELARSETVSDRDSMGGVRRINNRSSDDPEATARSANPQQGVQLSDVRPFSGNGRPLGGGGPAPQAAPAQAAPMQAASAQAAPASGREQWLQQLEASAAEKGKSVKQLEDDRLERERLEKECV